ncbi:hypothetical protein ACIRON_02825 [Nocardioides sp. NPDC101246]|uniref:hypothetical protein n=1 Tax=Nocardioides sp. NPDC101246 TaxID=3364336 RepID=UPI0037FDE760
MSELTDLRDHARERLEWQPGEARLACKNKTPFGAPKPRDHANCGGHRCGCECHRPTAKELRLWAQIAAEIDACLAPDDEADQDNDGQGVLL